MSFNPDPSKQAQEVIFRHKSKRPTYTPLVFNDNNVTQTFPQKHVGVMLYFKLTFEDCLNNVLAKVNRTKGLLRKLQKSITKYNTNYYIQSFHSATSGLR